MFLKKKVEINYEIRLLYKKICFNYKFNTF